MVEDKTLAKSTAFHLLELLGAALANTADPCDVVAWSRGIAVTIVAAASQCSQKASPQVAHPRVWELHPLDSTAFVLF